MRGKVGFLKKKKWPLKKFSSAKNFSPFAVLFARLRPCPRKFDAPTHRRTDAPTHRRTDAPTHRRTDAPTHRGDVVKSSLFLPWCRSWSRRVPILHGVLIAQMILMPFPPSSHAVWVPVDADGDGIFESGYDDGTPEPEAPPAGPSPTEDSDGDGLSNAEEAAAGSDPYNPDSDYDGLTDSDELNLTGTSPTSTDSNGDGVSDYNAFYGNYTVDTNTSGAGVTPYDHDGDGIADPVDPDPLSPQNDPDSDGDYVPDSQDTDPYNPAVWNDHNGNGINDDAETPNTDMDGDGVADDQDSHPADPALSNDWNYNGVNDHDEDWDGDGVTNLQDSHPNANHLWCDWNGNGVNDDSEGGTADNDGDGYADNSDSHPFNSSLWEDWNHNGTNDSEEQNNSDGDPMPDFQDSHPNDFNLWEDWNYNGINDSQEPPPILDRDGDGHNDSNDSDPDNNTLWSDWNRNGMNDEQEPPPMDSDGDGTPDESDSHPFDTYLWEDWNGNAYNDSTEDQFLDNDQDGTANAHDTHPNDSALWNDHNSNGINDQDEIIVTDRDGDGYHDDLDTHPDDNTLWNDHNNNGTNDELELPPDSDGDGIPDVGDEFPFDYDNDGLADAEEISLGSNPNSADTDGDGLRDGEEVYAGTDLLNVDTDGDGLTDFEELRTYFSEPLALTEIVMESENPSFVASIGEGFSEGGGPSNSGSGSSLTVGTPEIAIEVSVGDSVHSGNFLTDGATASFPSVSMKPDKSDQKRTFTIHNQGTAALTGLIVTLDGIHRTSFAFTPLTVTSLAPGTSTSLTITFQSSASRTAALHIASNDADEPSFDIVLRSVAGLWLTNKAHFFANLTDSDFDGIPDRVEEMYMLSKLKNEEEDPDPLIRWREITPGGDLDGDGISNLDEYLNGTDLRGHQNRLDWDGDGVTNAVEDTWNICMNKFRYSDAFVDSDGDGLLNIEELNGSHGTAAKRQGCVATSPIHVSSGPTSNLPTSNYNVASRRSPHSKAGESPFGGWYNRSSSYALWMTDGTLRYASLEVKLPTAKASQIKIFFTPELVFPPATNVPYKTKVGKISPAMIWGYDHVPKGYLAWLSTKKDHQGNPLQNPPLGGAEVMPTWNPYEPKVWPFSEAPVKRTPAPQGVLTYLSKYTTPASDDIDNDGMPNAWEASYRFNFRDAADSDVFPITDASDDASSWNAMVARIKDEFGLVKEYPIAYPTNGPTKYTLQEWTLMNRIDPDHDGLSNLKEYQINSNPRIADFAETLLRDSDGDGYSDGEEVALGTDHLNAKNNPGTLNQGGNIGTKPPQNPKPNSPFELKWDNYSDNLCQISWEQFFRISPQTQALVVGGGDMMIYDHNSPSVGRQVLHENGKVPEIHRGIRDTQFQNEYKIRPSGHFGAWTQMDFSVRPTYDGKKQINHLLKNWSHHRARVTAVVPGPGPVYTLQPLDEGARVTCLRVKKDHGKTEDEKDDTTTVIGTYTFTIPPGGSASEVFPTMLSFPFYRPPDSDSSYVSISYYLLPIEFEVTKWEPVITQPRDPYTTAWGNRNPPQNEIDDEAFVAEPPSGKNTFVIKTEVKMKPLNIPAADLARVASEWKVAILQDVVALPTADYKTYVGQAGGAGSSVTTMTPVPGMDAVFYPNEAPDPDNFFPFKKFTTGTETLDLEFVDTPKPSFGGVPIYKNGNTVNAAVALTNLKRDVTFVTWVYAEHVPTKARQFLKWIRWQTSWDVDVDGNNFAPPRLTKKTYSFRKIDEGTGQGPVTPSFSKAQKTTQFVPAQ
jgi:hypothetical protein